MTLMGWLLANIVVGGTEGIAYGEIDINELIDMNFTSIQQGLYK